MLEEEKNEEIPAKQSEEEEEKKQKESLSKRDLGTLCPLICEAKVKHNAESDSSTFTEEDSSSDERGEKKSSK